MGCLPPSEFASNTSMTQAVKWCNITGQAPTQCIPPRKNGLESTTTASRKDFPSWYQTAERAGSHVNLVRGLQHSSFSGNHKNVLLCLLRIFRDASGPLGYFQYFRSHKALADKTAHVVTTLGGKVSFALSLFSAWERWVFGGNLVTCICRITEFERRQS